MTEEQEIIKRFRQGDALAFDRIHQQYARRLYHFTYGFVKDVHLADELVQDIFVKLWEKREQVNEQLNFENYLFTIAFNDIRMFFRRKSVERKVKEFLVSHAPESIVSGEETVIYNELLEMANQSVEKMPTQRKRVYKMSREEGYKIREIARKLKISPRTAENHLAKAIKFLKEELSGVTLLGLLMLWI